MSKEKTETSGTSQDIVTRTRRRGMTRATLLAIAKLCAEKKLTTSAACRHLDIRPKTFFNWQSRNRNSERFAALIEEFEAGRLDELLNRIDAASIGKAGERGDWRAAAWLASIIDRSKYGSSSTPEHSTPPTVNLSINVAAILEKLKPVLPTVEQKQISNEGPKNT